MKALTIRQPWAGAIAHQTKRVENRTWKLPAKHEGARTLIHAGAKPDKWAVVYGPNLDVYSAIVAVATITGCHWSEDGTCCGPWGFASAYHWTLADVIALPEPVPASGALGFWTPKADVLAAVQAQLAEVARRKAFLCKHSFPCQPPHGSIFRPGDCTGCGITYTQREAELLRQEEALIVGSSRDGKCPDCTQQKRLFRWQPPAQPWDEPGAEKPVTFLCMDCFNAAVDTHNAMVNSVFEEAAR